MQIVRTQVSQTQFSIVKHGILETRKVGFTDSAIKCSIDEFVGGGCHWLAWMVIRS